MDINKVIVAGRLTRDPELTYTKSNMPLCKFSVAVNGMKKEDVNFFNVTAWNKTATNCSQFLKKGSQVIIDGRLNQQRWKDKNGQNRSVVDIMAGLVQFIGGNKAAGEKPQPNGELMGEPQDPLSDEDFPDFDQPMDNDEVPF